MDEHGSASVNRYRSSVLSQTTLEKLTLPASHVVECSTGGRVWQSLLQSEGWLSGELDAGTICQI